jgi:polysaccharide pyruvyl transferase WcaK-like protein
MSAERGLRPDPVPDSGGSTPRIGMWGTFDLENYGDLLFPLIARCELEARLGPVDLRVASPVGSNPVRFDGTEPSDALGPWRPEHLAELAGGLDAVLVGGGEIIHFGDAARSVHYGLSPASLESEWAASQFFIAGLGPALERECPVLWNAVGVPFDLDEAQAEMVSAALNSRSYIAVRDDRSRQRLLAAGVRQPITVVPDTALLIPRLLPPSDAAARVRDLRRQDLLPPGRFLVLQGNHRLVDRAKEVAEAVEHVVAAGEADSVALVEIGPSHRDAEFADAVCSQFTTEWRKLPASLHLFDVAAVIASSAGYVGTSLHGAITALAYGRSTIVLDFFGDVKIPAVLSELEAADRAVSSCQGIGFAWGGTMTTPEWDALAARIDAHFDVIAEQVRQRSPSRVDAPAGPADRVTRERAARRAISIRYVLDRRACEEKLASLRAELERQGAHLTDAMHELAVSSELVAQERRDVSAHRIELGEERERVARLVEQVRLWSLHAEWLSAQLEQALDQNAQLRTSHSWRLTAALRWVSSALKRSAPVGEGRGGTEETSGLA